VGGGHAAMRDGLPQTPLDAVPVAVTVCTAPTTGSNLHHWLQPPPLAPTTGWLQRRYRSYLLAPLSASLFCEGAAQSVSVMSTPLPPYGSTAVLASMIPVPCTDVPKTIDGTTGEGHTRQVLRSQLPTVCGSAALQKLLAQARSAGSQGRSRPAVATKPRRPERAASASSAQ
jgi:hypothetical protein